jgi:hypothetical protein
VRHLGTSPSRIVDVLPPDLRVLRLGVAKPLRAKAMPWAFLILMVTYGASCLVFAFVEPPGFLRNLYKVPRIFVFLPDRWVTPAGRLFVGACTIFVAIYVARAVLGVM